MRIAYLRVSTADQSIESQRLAIEKALGERPEREFVDEGVSGRVMQREGLDACLNALRAGDELVVYSLSRLGRSSAEVIRLVQELTDSVEKGGRGVLLRSVTESLDTSTPTGRAFLGLLAVVYALEAELIRERTLAGLAAARAKGRVGGRKPSLTPRQKKQALSLYEAGERPIDIADTMSVSERTVWRAIRDARAARERVHGKSEVSA
ncbi:recombinase family protein [Microbacterium maritypicum]